MGFAVFLKQSPLSRRPRRAGQFVFACPSGIPALPGLSSPRSFVSAGSQCWASRCAFHAAIVLSGPLAGAPAETHLLLTGVERVHERPPRLPALAAFASGRG